MRNKICGSYFAAGAYQMGDDRLDYVSRQGAQLFSAGVYQMGEDQARSWIVAGIPFGTGIPSVLAS